MMTPPCGAFAIRTSGTGRPEHSLAVLLTTASWTPCPLGTRMRRPSEGDWACPAAARARHPASKIHLKLLLIVFSSPMLAGIEGVQQSSAVENTIAPVAVSPHATCSCGMGEAGVGTGLFVEG